MLKVSITTLLNTINFTNNERSSNMKIPDKLPNPPKYRDFPELTKEEWGIIPKFGG